MYLPRRITAPEKDRSQPSQRRVVKTFTMLSLILFGFFAELGKLG
jgi:hypothetical protein